MKMIDQLIQRIKTEVPGVPLYEGWARGSLPYVCFGLSQTFGASGYEGSATVNLSVYAHGPDTTAASAIRDQIVAALDGYRVMTDDMGFIRVWFETEGQIPEEEHVVHLELSFFVRLWRHERAQNLS